MGIVYLDAQAYLAAKARGTSFARTMTLGHQNLFLHRQDVRDLRKQYRAQIGAEPRSLAGYSWGDFADDFLQEFLGPSVIDVLDASSYEGATIIHDMNEPVPAEWHDRYDAIIDCGSIEHIFNVPVVLRNLASMLTVGGTLFITTPANNLMGHGFYQFSPELMYRVFSEPNGFAVRRMTLREEAFPDVQLSSMRREYSVADPAQVGQRVGLVSKRPTMMFVEAVKISNADVFARFPCQSDYLAAWEARDTGVPRRRIHRRIAGRGLGLMPRPVWARIVGRRQRRLFSLRNTEFFGPQ